MNISRTARTRRPGFTLIEVLVAAGLCMLIMVVMTQAFAAGLDTFSVLKSTGELQERLAVAGTVLQTDLAATHLENQVGEPTRVSGIRFDKIGAPGFEQTARPPYRGFFRIQQEGISTPEGTGVDLDTIPCTRADGSTGKGHILHMAVKLPGTRQDRAFTANLPNAFWDTTDPNYGNAPYPALRSTQFLTNLQSSKNDYPVQWAEVAYFLNPTSTGTTASGTTQLYSLHRRIRILTADDNTGISWLPYQAALPGMSCNRVIPPSPPAPPGTGKFLNGPGDITVPDNRLGGKSGMRSVTSPATIDDFAALGTGDDILLSNVISFEIKANWDAGFGIPSPGWVVPSDPRPLSATFEVPFDDLPAFPSVAANAATYPNGNGNPSFSRSNLTPIDLARPRVFDTWTDRAPHTNWARPDVFVSAGPPQLNNPNPSYVPLPIRLKAIQIKLRIYDPKNKLARQITLIQDM